MDVKKAIRNPETVFFLLVAVVVVCYVGWQEGMFGLGKNFQHPKGYKILWAEHLPKPKKFKIFISDDNSNVLIEDECGKSTVFSGRQLAQSGNFLGRDGWGTGDSGYQGMIKEWNGCLSFHYQIILKADEPGIIRDIYPEYVCVKKENGVDEYWDFRYFGIVHKNFGRGCKFKLASQ